MNKKRRTLSKKLGRSIMWLAIPIFVVALSFFHDHAKIMIKKEAAERSATILNNTVLRIERYINLVETAARSNLWKLETYFNPDSLQSTSRHIVMLNAGVLSCSVSTEPDVFPEYGRYFSVYSVNEEDTVITMVEPDFNYFERVWYRKALHTGKPCWVEPFSDFSDGTISHHDAVASYCIPIRPGGGQIAGVVSTDFSFQNLSKTVVETDHPYPSSYYMLIGADGRYLVHPETTLLFKKTIFSNTDAIANPDIIALGREMTEGHEGIMHVNFDDVECHVCYAPIPGTSWSLALITPEDEVMVEYRHLTYIMIAVIILGLILIRWITGRVVKKNIQPVNQLLDATKKMADGNYDEIIPSTDRKDIISKLQNAFREMQLAIISHTKTIKETADELERENAELDEVLPVAKEAARRKNVFIQNVSAKIAKPLNVINGLANVLQDNLKKDDADRQRQAEEISDITNTMKHNASLLYSKMLMLSDSSDSALADTSRYQKNEWVSCNELAKSCIDLTEQYNSGTKVLFKSELPDTLKIITNHLYLKRTLRELLYNAAKHSDGKHVSLQVVQTDTTVRFIVEDKGPGLPKDAYDFIFMPFMKVDMTTEGLGLGLPLCKGHAVSLGGDLTYDESYHEGCRFILEVPKQ